MMRGGNTEASIFEWFCGFNECYTVYYFDEFPIQFTITPRNTKKVVCTQYFNLLNSGLINIQFCIFTIIQSHTKYDSKSVH